MYIYIYIYELSSCNKNVLHNITKNERATLKEIKTCCCVRVQDNDSKFVILANEDYCSKAATQIERGPSDITKSFETKIKDFMKNGRT